MLISCLGMVQIILGQQRSVSLHQRIPLSASVWTVVFPKGHVWDSFNSSSIHASQLFKVVEEQLLHKHCYSDDTQIYLSFLKA